MTGGYVGEEEVTVDVPPASLLLSNTPLSQGREEHWAPGDILTKLALPFTLISHHCVPESTRPQPDSDSGPRVPTNTEIDSNTTCSHHFLKRQHSQAHLQGSCP